MTDGMKKFRLAFASGIVEIEVPVDKYPDRQSLKACILSGQILRAVVIERVPRRGTRREAQFLNMGLVERIL